MLTSALRYARPAAAVAVAVTFGACARQTPATSTPLVTSVNHSDVKRQSIGNCWIYAEASWLESLLKTTTGHEQTVSESYWTWWDFYDQIVGSSETVLQTGGYWDVAANIIMRHGYVLEAEFIPSEGGVEMSAAQKQAEATIDAALAPGGALGTLAQRTPANVRAALDQAFGSNMAAAEALRRDPQTVVVKTNADGTSTTLAQALTGDAAHRWQVVDFPRLFGQGTPLTAEVAALRKAVLQRAMRALNDRAPVVIALMIDFNALDVHDATFKKALVDQNGAGRQGGHMVVLDDYAVDNAPGFGHIGFGDVPDAEKAAALSGDVVELKAKNSWGKNRPDRGLSDGYTSFDKAYLFDQLGWKGDGENPASPVSYYMTTLESFVIPPGY